MPVSSVIISENISKQYRPRQIDTGTLSHDLTRLWHRVRREKDPYLKVGERNGQSTKAKSDYVWALGAAGTIKNDKPRTQDLNLLARAGRRV